MIDWSKAPEWAFNVAMDEDGEWFWHEFKPKKTQHRGIEEWTNNGAFQKVDHPPVKNWRESLVSRPTVIPWSEMPDWVVCAAMNKNGAWYGCSTWMEWVNNDGWYGQHGCKYHLFSHIKVNDWLNSCVCKCLPDKKFTPVKIMSESRILGVDFAAQEPQVNENWYAKLPNSEELTHLKILEVTGLTVKFVTAERIVSLFKKSDIEFVEKIND